MGRVVFVALGRDKGECLQEVEGGDSSFLAGVEECIGEREYKLYDKGLNS